MKPRTEKKKEKRFDAVKTFRAIKEKISRDITDMNAQQIREYLKSKQLRPQK
ncbi:MAG TPA: hypothetical protein VK517_08195 [Cyclobacteriaceae bacterium]|nr:hypothetical protein [Cyclobacteriaceae bacterium]